MRAAYIEVLDVSKDLIVESKVVGWDDIDTGILLDLPVSKTETLGLSEELLLGDLASPVVLSGFLQVTVGTHAWETEDSADAMSVSGSALIASEANLRLNHVCGCMCESTKGCVLEVRKVSSRATAGEEYLRSADQSDDLS